ncbi:MAG: glycosyltransferase family 4 protein [Patescibacteria group bacterium]|nr:glycosyltransferase family 4 protein [Patescibacteria group bacterium]
MKKSLLISLYYPPLKGGISNSLWNVCMNLPEDKIVVLTEQANIKLRARYKIIRKKILSHSRFIWPKWLLLMNKLKKIVREEHIQILQAGQILPIGTVALLFKLHYGLPYIVYVYGQDLVIMRRSKWKMMLIRHILRNAEAVIANSEYTKKQALLHGAHNDRTIVVYPSPQGLIDTNVDQHYLDYFIERHNFINKKIILSVGNIVQRKGHDMVLRSLTNVIRKVPNALYVIVGDGSYRPTIENMIQRLGLSSSVRLYDKVSDDELPYFYRCCDVFIMPSRSLKNSEGEIIDVEGFGMVYLEANLFGKPVIGGNSGGVPEAIKDGISGLLVDPENSNNISDAIIQLLTNKKRAHELGEQGQRHARYAFRWQREVKKIVKLLA